MRIITMADNMYERMIPPTIEARDFNSNNNEIIDQETYHLLRDLMGEEGFDEIISFFCSDTKQAINNLQQAITERRAEYVGGICHKLKSSSKLIGAYNMAELSTELESYTEHKNQTKAIDLLKRLETEFSLVKKWIEHSAVTS